MTLPASQATPRQDDVILVVDDDPLVAATIAEALQAAGPDVAVAHNGGAAREYLATRSVALLLIDLQLPDVHGLTLLKEARAQDAPPDVVVITGNASIGSAIEAMEAGAGGYIEKPVDIARLRRVVARSLARRRLVRDNDALVAQLDTRRRQAEALYEISTTLASTLDLTDALRRLCREFARLFGADTVSAHLHDPERDLLMPIALHGVPEEHAAQFRSLTLPHRGQPFYQPLAEGQRAIASDDVLHDARFAHPAFRRFPHQSVVVLPLVIDAEMAGAFHLVWWRDRRTFSDDEVKLASQICDQASLFVRNARLFERAERDRRRIQMLNEVARKLAEIDETEAMLAFIAAEVRTLLGVEVSGLRLIEGHDLVLRAAGGEGVAALMASRLRVGESLSATVIAGGAPVVVEDLASDERFDVTQRRAASDLGFRAWVGVPLRAHGEIIGALAISAQGQRRFASDAVALLSAFADQASLAIQKSRLHAQTERARREAEQLYDVARQLASSPALDEILHLITRTSVEVLGADAAAIFDYDEPRGLLVVRRSVNLDPRHVAGLVLRPGESVVGRAFIERRPVWVRDRLATPVAYAEQTATEAIQYAPRAFLGVPIIVAGDVCGVITVYHRKPHDFTPDETQLLSTLASNAAVGIEKARLFAEVERQRQHLAAIFDSTSDGMLLIARDGQIVSANRRAAELLTFDPDARGLGLVDMLARHYPDETECLAAAGALRTAVEAGGDADGDLDLPAMARTLHWVARPAGALTEASSITLTDVTQEREVSRLKSDFVSFVTHQLRTPLAGIKWMLELATQTMAAADEATSYVGDAREAAERLIRLVNELLDVSRLESGRVAINPAPVDLAELTTEVLDDLTVLVKEKRHRLTVDATPAPQVIVDRQLVRQVVINLLSNAIKYTPEAGAITVRIAPRGASVAWSVQDTGIGIPAEAQARLFEKFYRAENGVAMETEGTGLGLYLTKLIVERFGGLVWCDSTEGAGSTFEFVVPLSGASPLPT